MVLICIPRHYSHFRGLEIQENRPAKQCVFSHNNAFVIWISREIRSSNSISILSPRMCGWVMGGIQSEDDPRKLDQNEGSLTLHIRIADWGAGLELQPVEEVARERFEAGNRERRTARLRRNNAGQEINARWLRKLFWILELTGREPSHPQHQWKSHRQNIVMGLWVWSIASEHFELFDLPMKTTQTTIFRKWNKKKFHYDTLRIAGFSSESHLALFYKCNLLYVNNTPFPIHDPLQIIVASDMPSLRVVDASAFSKAKDLRLIDLSRNPNLSYISPSAFENCSSVHRFVTCKTVIYSKSNIFVFFFATSDYSEI